MTTGPPGMMEKDMKTSARVIILAGALVASAATAAAFAHNDHGCGVPMAGNPMMGGSMMGGPMMGNSMMGNSMMASPMFGGVMMGQQPMVQMQAMMRQNHEVMERIVEEPDPQKRQELMQQHMQSMHGKPMDRYSYPGSGASPSAGQMQQQMEMMNRRMDMMQRMMEQIQQDMQPRN